MQVTGDHWALCPQGGRPQGSTRITGGTQKTVEPKVTGKQPANKPVKDWPITLSTNQTGTRKRQLICEPWESAGSQKRNPVDACGHPAGGDGSADGGAVGSQGFSSPCWVSKCSGATVWRQRRPLEAEVPRQTHTCVGPAGNQAFGRNSDQEGTRFSLLPHGSEPQVAGAVGRPAAPIAKPLSAL